jgi:phenylacetate-CoA ligase
VEVLDAQGRPCGPGERGEVIVTPLHNFASPLIRYDTGDIAEVGAACSCGRGLPVLTRVLGRVRQMITLPDGSRHWPGLPGARLRAAIPMRQFQFVQRARDCLDVYLVMERPMTADEERNCLAILAETFGPAFGFRLHFVERIDRSAGGKYEEFRSDL